MKDFLRHLPDPETVGRELAEGLMSQFDSLDVVEAVQRFEDRTGIEGGTAADQILMDPANELGVALFGLRELLIAGESVDARLFGVKFAIVPAPRHPSGPGEGGTAEGGPDPSGDREPRHPMPSSGALKTELTA